MGTMISSTPSAQRPQMSVYNDSVPTLLLGSGWEATRTGSRTSPIGPQIPDNTATMESKRNRRFRLIPRRGVTAISVEMARLTGFEPATSGVTGQRSNQAELQPPIQRQTLNADRRSFNEKHDHQAGGSNSSPKPHHEATVLPHYRPAMVGDERFELPASSV